MKNEEVLEAHLRIIENEPQKHNFVGVLKELTQDVPENVEEKRPEAANLKDSDQRLFFGEEFSDVGQAENKTDDSKVETKPIEEAKQATNEDKLIDYEAFDEFTSSSNILLPSQLLMDDSLFSQVEKNSSSIDLLGSLLPTQQSNDILSSSNSQQATSTSLLNKNPSKKSSDISKWFQLFSDLDPLNQQKEVKDANENMHAA